MRRFTPLLACAFAAIGAAVTPATAAAEPKILKAEVTKDPLVGQALGVHVEARDSSSAINGVEVRIPGHEGRFAISACRVGPDGKTKPTPALGAGKKVSFDVPYVPDSPGLQEIEVTVTSGACGDVRARARRNVSVRVGLAEVPALPGPNGGVGNGEVPRANGSQAGCANTDLLPTRKNLKLIRGAIICLINAQRMTRRLDLLHTQVRLRTAAVRHSRDMLRRSYFDHEGPAGPTLVDRLRRVGYWPASASENLAEGVATLSSPKAVVTAWMMSDGHRENILERRFRDIGVGVAVGPPNTATSTRAMYTVDFGRR